MEVGRIREMVVVAHFNGAKEYANNSKRLAFFSNKSFRHSYCSFGYMFDSF